MIGSLCSTWCIYLSEAVSHFCVPSVLLDTFFLGRLWGSHYYSFPYQGFDGPLFLSILYPSLMWCEINVIIMHTWLVSSLYVGQLLGSIELSSIFHAIIETYWSLDRVVVRSRSQIVKPDALFVVFLGIKWAHDIVKKIDHDFMGKFGP